MYPRVFRPAFPIVRATFDGNFLPSQYRKNVLGTKRVACTAFCQSNCYSILQIQKTRKTFSFPFPEMIENTTSSEALHLLSSFPIPFYSLLIEPLLTVNLCLRHTNKKWENDRKFALVTRSRLPIRQGSKDKAQPDSNSYFAELVTRIDDEHAWVWHLFFLSSPRPFLLLFCAIHSWASVVAVTRTGRAPSLF